MSATAQHLPTVRDATSDRVRQIEAQILEDEGAFHVAGVYYAEDSFRGRRAYVWADGTLFEPDVPDGSTVESINDDGLAAGTFRWRDPGDPMFGRYRAFVWQPGSDGVVRLTPAQLSMLLEGIDWRAPLRTWRPEVAG